MADPRSARRRALAEIQLINDKSQIAQVTEALLGQAAANAAALRGRASVDEADLAAEQATAGEPLDLTQFFGQVPINANDPMSALQRLGITMGEGGGAAVSPGAGGQLGAAGPGAARGGQYANQAIAQARRQAGTMATAAPTAAPAGGGGRVDIGGQTYEAPESITTTRETTAPFQIGPGEFFPATTRETITAPNVLTPGDLLQAAQRQEEFRQTQSARAAEFILSHSLQTNQAKVAMASDLITATNAPPDVAMAAADAFLSGNAELGGRLMAPYDTAGQSDMAYKRSMGNYYNALAGKAEVEMGLNIGSLYNFGSYFGIPPGTKQLTADQIIGTQENIADDLQRTFGGGGFGVGEFFGRVPSTAERAARISNIGKRAASIGQVVVFPSVGGKPSPTTIPSGVAVTLLDLAEGSYDDPAFTAAAQRTVEQLNIGRIDPDSKRVRSQGVPETLQPWVNDLHSAWRGHDEETLRVLFQRNSAAVEALIQQYAPAK